jgi:Rad3-related DNA helicase
LEPKIFFPLNLKPRDQQHEMLNFVSESISKAKKYMLLNAPTGSGKSYFVTMFINWYLNNIDEDSKFDIVTNSKALQEQYVKDFPYINNLKGKSNYRCDPFDTDCEKGMELCSALKRRCDNCPYTIKKKSWMLNKVSLTNFHLFNTFCLYNPDTLKTRDADSRVLIIDEAHDFEAVFSDFITISLSAKSLKKFGFDSNEILELDDRISRIKYLEEFISFIDMFFIDRIDSLLNRFETEVERTDIKKARELTKYINHIKTQKSKYQNFIDDYNSVKKDGEPDPKENWVLDIDKFDKDTMTSGIKLTVSPVWVYKYLPEYLWNYYDHIVSMSGTILNKNMFSFINGLDRKKTTYMELKTTFKKKNRPIYYIKCGKMTYREKKETIENQVKYIKKILKRNKDKKGVIHTTTYEFSKYLEENLFDKRLIFHDNKNREEKLEEHFSSSKPTVIVSPSMHTGFDFKDESSRFQIIMKIPYPNISSNKIKRRQETNSEWYNWKTVVDLVQGIGRSVRSEEDYAETYILDSSLSNILMYNNNLPDYVVDVIKEIKLK